LLVVGMVWGVGVWGATRYSVATGNWNATSTWSSSRGGASGASVPVAGDIVYIDAHTVTVTATAECSSVTFDQASGTLTVNTGITLTVSGEIYSSIQTYTKSATISGLGILNCGSIAVGKDLTYSVLTDYTNTLISTISTLNCSGNINIHGDYYSSYKKHSTFSIEGGIVSCNNIQLTTDGNVIVVAQIKNTTGSSTLKIAGTISTSENGANGTQTITLNDADSYVEYNGAASTVYPTSYPNFRISNTSGTVTLGGDINVAGYWDNDGTFSASTYNVTFNGGANQSILGDNSTTFNKIYVNNPGYTVTLTRNVTCTELNFNNTASAQTATFSVSTGVTLTINGSLTKTSVISTTYAVLTGSGTVNCTSINIGTTGTSGATVDAQNYFTSTVSTLTSTGDLTILGYCSGTYDIRTYCYFNSGFYYIYFQRLYSIIA